MAEGRRPYQGGGGSHYDRREDRSRPRGDFNKGGRGDRGGGGGRGFDGRRPQASTVAIAKAGPINVETNHFRIRLASPSDVLYIYSIDFGANDPEKTFLRAQAIRPIKD